jgi:hypothetical protein
MKHTRIICLGIAAALAGCATAPPSPLTLADARALRVESVNVVVDPTASISWANAENEFVNQKRAKNELPKPSEITTGSIGLQDPNAKDSAVDTVLIKSPEGQAYVKDKVIKRLSGALDEQVKASLNGGNRPAKLEVTVHSFIIPSAAQRVIVGGQPVINASVILRDSETGKVIAERPQMVSVAYAGNGWAGVLADQLFEDLDGRLVNGYAVQYKEWLMPKS